MSKFNTKVTPKQPTEVNEMGEKAFEMQPKEILVSQVLTTFLQDSYYMSESEIVKQILENVEKVDPLFVAKLALYARTVANMRSSSHLLGAALAKDLSGKNWSKRFYNRLVVRPDDMSETLSAYASLNKMDLKDIKKIPNSMKKGFKAVLENLDAYQIDKYKMKRRNVTLVDLVRLFHPKATQKNAEAYKRLIEGKSLEGLYSSKILEKEMTKAGQTASSKEEKEAAKQEAISVVLDNIYGMPIMNLIRNLRNILLIAPNRVKDACEQLRIEKKILNSRLLPFRFATAYAEIEKVSYNEEKPSSLIPTESEFTKVKISRIEFEKLKEEILDALEDAINISCQNIPEFKGNTFILCDDSGSMRGDFGGESKVSAFSQTRTSTIGHLFAAMVAQKQKDVYIGLFGDRLIHMPIDRSKGVLEFTQLMDTKGGECGGGTEAGIYDFLRTVVKEKKKVDNVIVFSDCQIGNGNSAFTAWYGRSYDDKGPHFHELFKEFRKINPQANFVVVNLRQVKNNSVFDRSQRILNVAGWSEHIFDVIQSNTKGWQEIINEIEKIEI